MRDFDFDDERSAEAAADLVLAASTLFDSRDVDATLQQVVDLAETTIDGCDFAGIFLPGMTPTASWVHTDPLVEQIDALQQRFGEGPCFEARSEGSFFYAEDLADDARWPNFAPAAVEQGIRSVLALHLSSNLAAGSLSLYARYPRAFGVIDRGKAVILAALAGIALASAQEHADEQRRIDNLAAALASREVIGQAQGILMERERVAADEAFDILRRASQHLNRKLKEVALDLVETGERPDTGPIQAPPSREET